ncbi:MAG: AMP-binding protein [Clostridium sp.]|nr:AMP-binding protein [Acetatifactor muris]MCM1527305.1 AMP-binding protein [Bacteroides sp.]MCM1563584.1 AMP-binding protein [Clostridium sp.]
MTEILVERIRELAASKPDRPAVAYKKEMLTYGQLWGKIQGMAVLLREQGVSEGDRVCFSAVSGPEMPAVYLATQLCGAIVVFLDKNATPENMAAVYERAGSTLLLTDKPMKEHAAGCRILSLRQAYKDADGMPQDEATVADRIQRDESAVAELLFTTGTTGQPKGVMLTYKAVYHILANTIRGIGIREDEILLLPLPLNHSYALRVLRAVLYQGAMVVFQNGFTFAKEVENNVNTWHCTALACVPASYEVMRRQMQDAFVPVCSRFRYIEFGAGSLSVQQRKEITSLLPGTTIYNTWGSSESGGAIFCNVSEVVKDPVKVASLGRPLEGAVCVKFLDEDGNLIEANVSNPGRMTLQGDMQMAGYWNMPSLTAEALVDGWLVTGDMAYEDRDGYIYMLGRADDIINVGGEKVSPIEVENIAGQYPGIQECACIGVEDEDGVMGQVPVLFVVVKSGYSEEELIKFISDRAERYKLPRKVMQLESLPRNAMQKLDRKELRKIWENRGSMDLMNPVIQALLSRRSIRRFTDREIPKEILEMILRTGYHAPSGHNMQSWKFTVLTKQEDIQRLRERTRETALREKVNFYGFENPQAIILVSNDKRNPHGCQDASCAVENMMLAAYSYGIGSVWLNPLRTLRDVEPVKTVLDDFEVPENHIIWASVALGYPYSEGAMLKKRTDVIKYV